MSRFAYPREHPAIPSGLVRLDDRAKICRNIRDPDAPWEDGTVTEIGVLNGDGVCSHIEVTLDNREPLIIDPLACPVDDDPRRVVVFPKTEELQRTDPTGKLRQFAEAASLLIAREVTNTDEPIYRLVDPAKGYEALIAKRIKIEYAAVQFAQGRLAVTEWAAAAPVITLSSPGAAEAAKSVLGFLGLPRDLLLQ